MTLSEDNQFIIMLALDHVVHVLTGALSSKCMFEFFVLSFFSKINLETYFLLASCSSLLLALHHSEAYFFPSHVKKERFVQPCEEN